MLLLLAILLPASPVVAAYDDAGFVEAHRGKVVVLNYWASWCAPCVKELPLLARAQREYGPRGVQVLGVSIDEDRGAAEAFARRHRLAFPLRLDGSTREMVSRKLGDAVPATLVLDRDGTPLFRLIGEIKEADLRARLEWALDDRRVARPEELVLPAGITAEHFREHHESGEDEGDEHHEEETEGGSAVPT